VKECPFDDCEYTSPEFRKVQKHIIGSVTQNAHTITTDCPICEKEYEAEEQLIGHCANMKTDSHMHELIHTLAT